MPPLRERREDIPLLADHFWREATARSEPRDPGAGDRGGARALRLAGQRPRAAERAGRARGARRPQRAWCRRRRCGRNSRHQRRGRLPARRTRGGRSRSGSSAPRSCAPAVAARRRRPNWGHAPGADEADVAAGNPDRRREGWRAIMSGRAAVSRSPPAADHPGPARRRDAGVLADSSRARRSGAGDARRSASPQTSRSCAAGSGSTGRSSCSTAPFSTGCRARRSGHVAAHEPAGHGGDCGADARDLRAGARRDARGARRSRFRSASWPRSAPAPSSTTRRRRWRWSGSRCRISGSDRCWRSSFR